MHTCSLILDSTSERRCHAFVWVCLSLHNELQSYSFSCKCHNFILFCLMEEWKSTMQIKLLDLLVQSLSITHILIRLKAKLLRLGRIGSVVQNPLWPPSLTPLPTSSPRTHVPQILKPHIPKCLFAFKTSSCCWLYLQLSARLTSASFWVPASSSALPTEACPTTPSLALTSAYIYLWNSKVIPQHLAPADLLQ